MPGPEAPSLPQQEVRPHQQFLEELLPQQTGLPPLTPETAQAASEIAAEQVVQELPIEQRTQAGLTTAEEVRDWTATRLNTGLNHLVGHRKQSREAEPIVDELAYARANARLALEISDHQAGNGTGELSDEVRAAIDSGATPQSLLETSLTHVARYEQLEAERSKSFGFERALTDARTAYISELIKRPGLRHRKARRERLGQLEAAYNEALLGKIAGVMDMDPLHDKAPYSASEMRDIAEVKPDLETLSGSQLFVLVDQLSREQLAKSEAIERMSNQGTKRVSNVLKNNRAARVLVAGAVWAGSLISANKGVMPERLQVVGDAFEYVMPMMAGYITSREVLAGVDDGVQKLRHSRQMKRDIKQLTSDTFLTEATLATVYGSIEYDQGHVLGRQAGTTEQEHRDALGNIDAQYAQLQAEGARGGKPYKAETVLAYAAELLLRRKEQLAAIETSDDPKASFLELSKEVISADTRELTERQRASRAKRIVYRTISLGAATFANQWTLQLGSQIDRATKGPDMLKKMTPQTV